MEFCPILDMIGDYFPGALQGSQFRRFRNIIIRIHQDDILSYNASGRVLLKERKVKLEKDKEEAQKATKLVGD